MENNATVDEWLEKLSPDLQIITRELIAAARKNMPNARELIITTRLDTHSTTRPLTESVISLRRKRATSILGFSSALGLQTEEAAGGEGKRIRHIKIRSMENAKNPALAKLIAATWKEAPEHVAQVHAGMKKSE